MTTTRVVLVRHGETDWNRTGRLQGWAPVPLNDRGRQQARRLGTALADRYSFDRVVASDLSRTRETTAILTQQGIDAHRSFERGWRERDIGVYQGLLAEDLFERFPAFAAESGALAVDEQPPGGERLLDTCERVRGTWEQLRERARDETVLVVTHSGPIRLLLGHLDGQDALTALADHAVPNCSVTNLRVDDEVRVERVGEQPFETVPPATE